MGTKLNTFNYYELLNISFDADESQITKAYRSIAKEKHPDNFPNATKNELVFINQVFDLYTQAYKTLKSPLERKKYDTELNKRLKKLKKEEIIKTVRESQKNEINKDSKDTQGEDLSSFSSITNDPRLKDMSKSFTFSKMNYVDVNKDLEEFEQSRQIKQKELFKQAINYIEHEKYDNAINTLKELLEFDSRNSDYHAYLGLASLKKGWFGYAQAEFKVALNCNPNNEMALKHYEELKKKTEPLQKQKKKKSFWDFLKNLFFKKK